MRERYTALGKLVFAGIHPRPHREPLSINDALQHAQGTVQPVVPLILRLKGRQQELLARVPVKEGTPV